MTEKVKISTLTVKTMEKAGSPRTNYFELNGKTLSISLL